MPWVFISVIHRLYIKTTIYWLLVQTSVVDIVGWHQNEVLCFVEPTEIFSVQPVFEFS